MLDDVCMVVSVNVLISGDVGMVTYNIQRFLRDNLHRCEKTSQQKVNQNEHKWLASERILCHYQIHGITLHNARTYAMNSMMI